MKTIIYPGTFDPVTLGHLDLIERAAACFDQVIVAVAVDSHKQPMFTVPERIGFIEESLTLGNVQVTSFSGLLVDFVKSQQARLILRGLRAVADFEYEFQLASMNRHLASEIETLFLTPSEQYSYVSSSLVREVALLGGDVEKFVPPAVSKAFHQKPQK